MPKCPKHLSAVERQLWNEVGKPAAEIGLLTPTDAGVFEVYVTALALMRTVKPELKKLLCDSKTGSKYQNPYLAIYNKAKEHVMKAGAELGFTPSSRSRVTVADKKQDEDPFAMYDGGK
jgi:P27 family predicted phage terminase small subunit